MSGAAGAAARGALALAVIWGAACASPSPPAAGALAALPWDSIVARARGAEVTWRMWRGDPSVNAFVDHWVAPRVAERFAIRLTAVEGQGAALVNQLLAERRAGAAGTADLVWINGETFASLRAEDLLYGPWADRLPHAPLVDHSPIVRRDWGQDPAGYEAPWGRVQFALIYDTTRTPTPPRTVAALTGWILAHPGRFTHDQGFTGMAFLKVVLYALNGGPARLQGGFDEETYRAASRPLFAWLDRVTPAFWRGGATYPPDVADLHRLFANGEVDFTMSYNQHEVVSKVRQGVLPPGARPLLLRDGTLANAHYVAIPVNAPAPAAAMVIADFLLSPEAQLEKARPEVWADGTVLDVAALPPPWPERFAALEADPRALSPESLAAYAVPEIDPAYHERLRADWRARIRRGAR